MSTMRADPTLVRERHLLRADRLKKRATAFSLLGFVAFFGLAAQHVVRGASASTRQAVRPVQREATSGTTYFDESGSGFSFGDSLPSGVSSDVAPATQPPVAQTSVS